MLCVHLTALQWVVHSPDGAFKCVCDAQTYAENIRCALVLCWRHLAPHLAGFWLLTAAGRLLARGGWLHMMVRLTPWRRPGAAWCNHGRHRVLPA